MRFPKEGRRISFFVFQPRYNLPQMGKAIQEERWLVRCRRFEEPFVKDEMAKLGWSELSSGDVISTYWNVGISYFYGGPLMMPVGYQPIASGWMSDQISIQFSRMMPDSVMKNGEEIPVRKKMTEIEARLQKDQEDLTRLDGQDRYGIIYGLGFFACAASIGLAVTSFYLKWPLWALVCLCVASVAFAALAVWSSKKQAKEKRSRFWKKERVLQRISSDFFEAEKISRLFFGKCDD
jgi:hypothetical protein